MARKDLKDKTLQSLKPATPGSRYEIMDTRVPGLGLRVTDKGQKTFIFVARYPGSPNPTRRALGPYGARRGALTLEQARTKARSWTEHLSRGRDPKDVERYERLAEQRRQENSFAHVVEDYLRSAVLGSDPERPLQRKGRSVARELRDEFVLDKVINGRKRHGLGPRPIDSITPADIKRVIDDAIERRARHQARNLLGHVRVMFNWALACDVYGLTSSPCDRMKPKHLIGPKALRTRVLSDEEIAVYWKAAERLGYPFGDLFKLLLVTGQRKSEVGEAVWSEFDLAKRLWTIPAERMKTDAPHVVPLSDGALAILQKLPRFKGGDFLFSTTFGRVPVSGFSKAKARLDKHMLWILRVLARKRGRGPDLVTLPDFVLHDARRTMRTQLSSLPVSSEVAELVIAHARPGLRRVYDQFGYLDEKQRALDLWWGKLRAMITPPPANVARIQKVMQ